MATNVDEKGLLRVGGVVLAKVEPDGRLQVKRKNNSHKTTELGPYAHTSLQEIERAIQQHLDTSLD